MCLAVTSATGELSCSVLLEYTVYTVHFLCALRTESNGCVSYMTGCVLSCAWMHYCAMLLTVHQTQCSGKQLVYFKLLLWLTLCIIQLSTAIHATLAANCTLQLCYHSLRQS
jgi:hypothetical protein